MWHLGDCSCTLELDSEQKIHTVKCGSQKARIQEQLYRHHLLKHKSHVGGTQTSVLWINILTLIKEQQ